VVKGSVVAEMMLEPLTEVDDAELPLPPTIAVSTQDTKSSSVYLQTHSHLKVTRPDGMSAGKLTI